MAPAVKICWCLQDRRSQLDHTIGCGVASCVFVAFLGRIFSLVYTVYTMYTHNIIYIYIYIYANTYRDICRIVCASGNIWGFVEGSDAVRAIGGSWRGQMPAARSGVRGGVRCQRQIITLCV